MEAKDANLAKYETHKLLEDYKHYLLFLVPLSSFFAIFFTAGFFIYLLIPTDEMGDGMWVVSLVALAGAAFFIWLTVLFIKIVKDIKAELNSRTITQEEEEYANRSLWTLIKIFVGVIVATIIITLIAVGGIGSGGNSSNTSISECVICGKNATHKFQNSSYCTKHYNDAVKWAIDNVD